MRDGSIESVASIAHFRSIANDWSTWCLAALLVVASSLHLLVLIDEEHLRRIFGENYVAFCRDTPRYFG
jgi:protein-S-isoprenylcysteine O-methyltransferase Ste14